MKLASSVNDTITVTCYQNKLQQRTTTNLHGSTWITKNWSKLCDDVITIGAGICQTKPIMTVATTLVQVILSVFRVCRELCTATLYGRIGSGVRDHLQIGSLESRL